MSSEKPRDIYDTSAGQCNAGLHIRGEYFRCDLAVDHDGWAHTNTVAVAIWRGTDR